MIKENCIEAKDRVAVLLALASQEPADKGQCPSVWELAAFNDGGMRSGKRKAMMMHLDACPTCYSDWLALPPPPHRPLSLRTRLRSAIDTAVTACSEFAEAYRPHSFSGLVQAAAVCLLVFISAYHLRHKTDMAEQIGESYQAPFVRKMTFNPADANKIFILPWNKPVQSYGFGSSNRHDPPYRAFGAGLWTGKQELSAEKSPEQKPDFLYPGWQNDTIKAEEWSGTPYATYFSMGQWCFLMRSVCLSASEVPPAFWEQQNSLLEKIQDDFGESSDKIGEDAKIVTDRLGNIRYVLGSVARKSPGKRQRGKIARELGILMDRLSPRSLPQSF